MKSEIIRNNKRRLRRRNHVRRLIRKHSDRVRLSVFRSSKHIYAQLVDDVKGATLAHVSSASKSLSGDLVGKNKSQRAAVVGAEIARKAKEAGVEAVVFDRGQAKYHGRVKALADSAREAGLKF